MAQLYGSLKIFDDVVSVVHTRSQVSAASIMSSASESTASESAASDALTSMWSILLLHDFFNISSLDAFGINFIGKIL